MGNPCGLEEGLLKNIYMAVGNYLHFSVIASYLYIIPSTDALQKKSTQNLHLGFLFEIGPLSIRTFFCRS